MAFDFTAPNIFEVENDSKEYLLLIFSKFFDDFEINFWFFQIGKTDSYHGK